MKKITTKILFVLFTFLLSTDMCRAVSDTGGGTFRGYGVEVELDRDTVVEIDHPNSADSVLVVAVVNGAIQVFSIAMPQVGTIFQKMPWIGPAITGVVLWFWRMRTVRRLRRKGYVVRYFE